MGFRTVDDSRYVFRAETNRREERPKFVDSVTVVVSEGVALGSLKISEAVRLLCLPGRIDALFH